MSDPIRIVLADDHPPTRAGVRASLEGEGFAVVAECPDATCAVEAAFRERPDVCLLDIHMPGGGIAAAAEIHATLPGTAIVMLTVSREDEDLFAALRAGASGYLLKDTDPARLPMALQGVLRGEAALPRTLAARLIEEFGRRDRPRRLPFGRGRGPTLTAREWEALDLMRAGLPTSEIADRMGISAVTVRRHISAILAKLRVESREEALRLIAEHEES